MCMGVCVSAFVFTFPFKSEEIVSSLLSVVRCAAIRKVLLLYSVHRAQCIFILHFVLLYSVHRAECMFILHFVLLYSVDRAECMFILHFVLLYSVHRAQCIINKNNQTTLRITLFSA